MSSELMRVYNYLRQNCYGKEKGIKREELASALGISTRLLRHYTRQINLSADFDKLISTKDSCYMCKTKDECRQTIHNTYNTAIALFKKAKRMEKKVGLNSQVTVSFNDGDQTIRVIESYN